MIFKDVNEFTAHYAKELYYADKVESTNPINSEKYKNELGGEAAQQFFTIEDAQAVVGTYKNHKGYEWWMYGEILSEMLNLDPPIMYKYKPEMYPEHYDLLADGRMQYTYGNRFVEFGQFVNIHEKLKKNINSKRAVMSIYTPYDTAPDRKDAPCTLGYNFLHRDGKFNMTTFMRSWDFFGGAKTYDFALSSFIQQSFCNWLDVKPGKLNYYVNSLHYYNRDQEQLEKLVMEVQNPKSANKLILDGNQPIGEFYDELRLIKLSEEYAHSGNIEKANEIKDNLNNELFKKISGVFIKKNE